MGIWILESQVGNMTRAVLVASDTEMPLATPCFDDTECADSFVDYCNAEPCFDIRRANAAELDMMRQRWEMLPKCAETHCSTKAIDSGEKLCRECRSLEDTGPQAVARIFDTSECDRAIPCPRTGPLCAKCRAHNGKTIPVRQ